jgi:hypothetical protein
MPNTGNYQTPLVDNLPTMVEAPLVDNLSIMVEAPLIDNLSTMVENLTPAQHVLLDELDYFVSSNQTHEEYRRAEVYIGKRIGPNGTPVTLFPKNLQDLKLKVTRFLGNFIPEIFRVGEAGRATNSTCHIDPIKLLQLWLSKS